MLTPTNSNTSLTIHKDHKKDTINNEELLLIGDSAIFSS